MSQSYDATVRESRRTAVQARLRVSQQKSRAVRPGAVSCALVSRKRPSLSVAPSSEMPLGERRKTGVPWGWSVPLAE